jgi:hypothetical protein
MPPRMYVALFSGAHHSFISFIHSFILLASFSECFLLVLFLSLNWWFYGFMNDDAFHDVSKKCFFEKSRTKTKEK